MKIEAQTPEEYIEQLPEDRKEVIIDLRKAIKENLPAGFSEQISYGMIGYVVPHSIYPEGYHVNNSLPLPFINLASQKNYIALYHSGIYSIPNLMEWFKAEYPKHSQHKLDLGKSCIRFKKMNDIPFALIGELAQKVTVNEWIAAYESIIKKA
jgi:hypothetical protein